MLPTGRFGEAGETSAKSRALPYLRATFDQGTSATPGGRSAGFSRALACSRVMVVFSVTLAHVATRDQAPRGIGPLGTGIGVE